LLPHSRTPDINLDTLYQNIQELTRLDALGSLAYYLPIRLAIGNVFHDQEVGSHVWYQYRITRALKDRQGEQFLSDRVKFPRYCGFDPIEVALIDRRAGSLYIKWTSVGLNPPKHTQVFQLTESKENSFVAPAVQYTIGDTTHYVYYVEDYTSENVDQYYLTPLDRYGNQSDPSAVALVQPLTLSQNQFRDLNAENISELKGIKLSWSLLTSAYISEVQIWRSAEFDHGFKKIASVSPELTEHVDLNIKGDKIYYYQLRALHAHAKDNISSTRFFDFGQDPQAPIAPAILNLVELDHSPFLQVYTPDPETHGVRVYGLSENRADTILLSDLVTHTSDTVIFPLEELVLNPGERYELFVRAENNSGLESPYSESFIWFAPDNTPLPPLTGLESWIDGDELVIHWDDLIKNNPRVAGYEVSIKDHADSDWTVVSSTDSLHEINSLVINNPSQVQHLDIAVAPVSHAGLAHQQSLTTLFIPVYKTPAIAGLQAQVDGQNVYLNWPVSDDTSIQQYNIYRRALGESAKKIASLPSADHEYLDRPNYGLYYYYIQTIDANDQISDPSIEIAVRVK